MSADGGDPLTRALTWIDEVGKPMRAEVEGLKRAMWWLVGAGGAVGLILGALGPFLLKKWGLSG